jgi:hypothetical protein
VSGGPWMGRNTSGIWGLASETWNPGCYSSLAHLFLGDGCGYSLISPFV